MPSGQLRTNPNWPVAETERECGSHDYGTKLKEFRRQSLKLAGYFVHVCGHLWTFVDIWWTSRASEVHILFPVSTNGTDLRIIQWQFEQSKARSARLVSSPSCIAWMGLVWCATIAPKPRRSSLPLHSNQSRVTLFVRPVRKSADSNDWCFSSHALVASQPGARVAT